MEDDAEIASLYSQVLNNRGHEVTITRLGEDCLQIYADRLQELYTKKPDLPEGLMWLFLITGCLTEMGWR